MTTITVELTENSILITEAGNTDATAGQDPLPPLTAARYLVVAAEAAESLRQVETPLIELIQPHAHSTLVALETGFGATVDGEDGPPAMRLAAALGVTVVAAAGRFLSCDGALFAVGADNGWIAYSPLGTKIAHGRRYPAPPWQAHVPAKVEGTVQIPAGLWITAGADPSHAVHLAEIAVHPQQMLIVVGSPDEPVPEFARVRDVLRELPAATRASAVLIGYDDASLEQDTIRLLAEELQQPIRIAHGVMRAGKFVRLDLARETPTGTFAKESVCTPDGVFELEHWSAPLGLTTVSRNTYRLAHDWLVDVVPAGLIVHPAHQPSYSATDSLPIVGEELTVMLRGEGSSDLKRVAGPLRMLLERLRDYAPTRLIPGDRAARQLIRNAFPGAWAPTAQLALTEDGRIIAASIDDVDFPVVEEEHSEISEAAENVVPPGVANEGDEISVAEAIRGPESEPAPVSEHSTVVASEHVPMLRHGTASITSLASAIAPHDRIVSIPVTPTRSSTGHIAADDPGNEQPQRVENASARQPPVPPVPQPDNVAVRSDSQGASSAAIALPQPVTAPTAPSSDPSDALARALRGSAATADLLTHSASRTSAFDAAGAVTGAAGTRTSELSLPAHESESDSRGTTTPRRPATTRAEASALRAAEEIASVADAVGEDAVPTASSVEDVLDSPPIEVSRVARSTAAQRHRVRSVLGGRYDVASRSVSQLLAQQPGMRVSSGDRSTLLTTLSVVSVFAEDPTGRYDIDFHTCLAEGLAALPTTRSIVVRGLPQTTTATTHSMLYSRTPFISAPVDGPLTGPVEALIWTTSGRRLDRLMEDTDAATDVIVPAHTQLRVLGTADGPVPRLLLAEDGVLDDSVLTRLHDAAASRGNVPTAIQDSRWLGELLAAV